jgi:hypothetical protein
MTKADHPVGAATEPTMAIFEPQLNRRSRKARSLQIVAEPKSKKRR